MLPAYHRTLKHVSSILTLVLTLTSASCSTAQIFDRKQAESIYGSKPLSDEDYQYAITGIFMEAKKGNPTKAQETFTPGVRHKFTEQELNDFLKKHSLIGLTSYKLRKISTETPPHLTLPTGAKNVHIRSIYDVVDSTQDRTVQIGVNHFTFGNKYWVEALYVPEVSVNSTTNKKAYAYLPSIPEGKELNDLLSSAYQSYIESSSKKDRYDVGNTDTSRFKANMAFSRFKDKNPQIFQGETREDFLTDIEQLAPLSAPTRLGKGPYFEVELSNTFQTHNIYMKVRYSYVGVKWEYKVLDFQVEVEG